MSKFNKQKCVWSSHKWDEIYIFWICDLINVSSLVEGVDNVEQVTTVVHGVILGVEMPFPLQNPDACKDSGIVCPLKNGENYEYLQTLPVLRSYPKVIDKILNTKPQTKCQNLTMTSIV